MTELTPEMAGRYAHLSERAGRLRGKTSTDRSRLLTARERNNP